MKSALFFLSLNQDPEKLGDSRKITQLVRDRGYRCPICRTLLFLPDFLFSSVTHSCLTLCDRTDWTTPGFTVHQQLPELAQTHVHWVNEAIHPSHPLLSPPPPAFNLSHHQGIFQWVSSLNQVAIVLEVQLQHQYVQWIFRTVPTAIWPLDHHCLPLHLPKGHRLYQLNQHFRSTECGPCLLDSILICSDP